MKIRSMGAELFHADGLIDMAKLIVAFRNFANEPKNPLWHFAKLFVTKWPADKKCCAPLL